MRIGGEEFVVVLRNIEQNNLAKAAEKLRMAIEDLVPHVCPISGEPIHITCSIGFFSLPLYPAYPSVFTPEEYLTLADLCLYYAKRTGRNRCIGLQSGLPPATREHHTLALTDLLESQCQGMYSLIDCTKGV